MFRCLPPLCSHQPEQFLLAFLEFPSVHPPAATAAAPSWALCASGRESRWASSLQEASVFSEAGRFRRTESAGCCGSSGGTAVILPWEDKMGLLGARPSGHSPDDRAGIRTGGQGQSGAGFLALWLLELGPALSLSWGAFLCTHSGG